jgi:signal transduction histidine kinase
MDILKNLDLFSVGLTIAGIGVLGFTIYFNDRKSLTNKLFLIFALFSIFWSATNYAYYQINDVAVSFWFLRGVIFLGVWHALSFFILAYVFPEADKKIPRYIKYAIIPLVAVCSVINLTPLVFRKITSLSAAGQIVRVENGPFIALFSTMVAVLVIWGIVLLSMKTFSRRYKAQKKQLGLVLAGVTITFWLIVTFNLILPAYFNDPGYISLGALFIFPFIAFTSYAIYKHHLFEIKIAAISFVAFILTVFSFFNILYAGDASQIVINITFFLTIMLGSIILIRSTLREIEQREKVQKLATDLEKANVRLTELDRQKSEFVSFATHQLRSPLTAMKGYASMILEGDMGKLPKEAEEGVSRIYDSAKTLTSIVDDYLNISRIELGSMKYAFDTVDMKALVSDTIAELKPNIDRSKLSFSFVADENGTDYRVTADRDKLKQVIANLIDNSIKYTPSGSVAVSLSFDHAKDKFIFQIKDTGIGIAPEVLPHLFQKWSRADNANKANIRGTGLGLYVAKEMVEAHHGTIRAESEGEGKGSAFTVELEPLGKV